jgi:hypothetical protein
MQKKKASIAEQLKQILNHLQEVSTKFGYNINIYLVSIIFKKWREIVVFAVNTILIDDSNNKKSQ